MSLYSYTIKTCSEKIHEAFPDARAVFVEPTKELFSQSKALAEYCLWMMEKISEMQEEDSKKAARWIGWIFCSLEVLGLITNTDSRNMAKIDKENGNV